MNTSGENLFFSAAITTKQAIYLSYVLGSSLGLRFFLYKVGGIKFLYLEHNYQSLKS